eukprot:12937800-Prorocentrum_lima.AAC.1
MPPSRTTSHSSAQRSVTFGPWSRTWKKNWKGTASLCHTARQNGSQRGPAKKWSLSPGKTLHQGIP